MPENNSLFSPLTIGQLTLPVRIYKTATSETRADPDGFVTDELLEFYEPIAAAGTPLIITGNLYTSVQGKVMGTKPRALKLNEIEQVINEFADAAERAKKAGMDGVQIHVGHGYLLSQFPTPCTNRRKDQYGGSFAC